MAKIHYPDDPAVGEAIGTAICGWTVVPLSTDITSVACKLCLPLLAALLAARVEAEAAAYFDPAPVHGPRIGARLLDEVGTDALRASLEARVVSQRCTWRSLGAALDALVRYREDGPGVGSTANPARFEQVPQGRRDRTRSVTRDVDQVVPVERALERAYPGPRAFAAGSERVDGVAVDIDPIELSVAQQQEILVWCAVGEPNALASTVLRRRGASYETVAAELGRRWGVEGLTENRVELVHRAGRDAMLAALRAVGELSPAERRDTPPAARRHWDPAAKLKEANGAG